MNHNVLILTEAGADIGFGHYTRCSAIQQALLDSEIQANMMIYLNNIDIDAPHLIKVDWLNQLDEVLKQQYCSVVVVDSYIAGNTIYSKLSQTFKHVIAIDDYNRIVYQVEWVINPNVFFNDIDYTNQTAKLVGGKDYIVLRKTFRENAITNPIKDSVKHILVTIGGSDFRNILPSIIEACAETSVTTITVIAPEELSINTSDDRIQILPVQNAEGMKDLMLNADVVISACGQTLHELVSLGKATIGICLDIDQVPNQKFYLQQGFLPIDLQWNEKELKHKIIEEIANYHSVERRTTILNLSRSLINKDGVLKIASLIKNMHDEC